MAYDPSIGAASVSSDDAFDISKMSDIPAPAPTSMAQESTSKAPAYTSSPDEPFDIKKMGDVPEDNTVEELVVTAPRIRQPEPSPAYQKASPANKFMDFLGTMASNVPGSAVNLAKGVWNAGTHPIQTAQTIGSLGAGVIQHVRDVLPAQHIFNAPGTHIDTHTADAVGQMFVDRYGSVDKALNTAKTDPVGFLSDASMLFTGGGTAAAKLGGVVSKLGEIGEAGSTLSKIGEAGNALRDVGTGAVKFGEAIDPLSYPGKTLSALGDTRVGQSLAAAGGKVASALKPIVQGPGNALAETLGASSSAGGKAVKTAFDVGARGKDAQKIFSDAQRGIISPEDVLNQTKEHILQSHAESSLAPEVQKAYENTSVDTSGIKRMFEENPKLTGWEIPDRMSWNELNDLRSSTAIGSHMFDADINNAFKDITGKIGETLVEAKPPEAAALTSTANKAHKAWQNVKSAYEAGADQGVINKRLDTLQKEIAKLPQSSRNISPAEAALAGQRTSSFLPEKITGLADLTIGGLLHTVAPALTGVHGLAAIPSMSPRIVGTAANVAGKMYGGTSRSLGSILKGNTNITTPIMRGTSAMSFLNEANQNPDNPTLLPYSPRIEPTQSALYPSSLPSK